MAESRNILSLSTSPEQQHTIEIDGTAFTLIDHDSLSIVERQRMLASFMHVQNLATRIKDAVEAGASVDDIDMSEVSSVITTTFDRILPGVPAEMSDRLSEAKKMQVIGAFFGLMRPPAPEIGSGDTPN